MDGKRFGEEEEDIALTDCYTFVMTDDSNTT
jgi:hypothetical protein